MLSIKYAADVLVDRNGTIIFATTLATATATAAVVVASTVIAIDCRRPQPHFE